MTALQRSELGDRAGLGRWDAARWAAAPILRRLVAAHRRMQDAQARHQRAVAACENGFPFLSLELERTRATAKLDKATDAWRSAAQAAKESGSELPCEDRTAWFRAFDRPPSDVVAWRRRGDRFLSIVAGQDGRCGDSEKDPGGKGCGRNLYVLPAAAVHLDHVIPRSQGGTDGDGNVQALCVACNLSAGGGK